MGVSKERFTSVTANWKCILICFGMALANCQFGFDAAAVGGFQAMPGFLQVFGYFDTTTKRWGIETQPQQLIGSCMNIGTIIGVAMTPVWGRSLGRRPAIWLAGLLCAVSLGVQLGADTVAALCVGRVILGISNAFYITFSNVYMAETTPPHLRPAIGSFFGIWVNIGNILGAVANWQTSAYQSRLAYQIPLASLFALPVVLSVIVFFIPESPRWLLVQGRPAEAERALTQLRGDSLSPEFFKEEFQEMARGIEEEKALARSSSFMDMFRGTDLRRTILCSGVTLSHSSSGVWLFIAYGTYFYQMAGITDPFRVSIYSCVTNLGSACFGIWLMYKVWGRRMIMLFGTAATVGCFLGAAIAFTVAPNTLPAGQAIVAFCLMYSFFYTGFSGTLSWPMANELVSSRLRVVTFSFATGINYFFSWLISYCSPYFINPKALNWGAKYCYIWAGSNAITWLFFYLFLPEVTGRSLEEIDELFQNRVPRRDFPKYECISAVRAHEAAVRDLGLEKKGTEVEPVEMQPQLRD